MNYKNSLQDYYQQLKTAVADCGADFKEWGKVEGLPIYCLQIKGKGKIQKKKLVTTGFHGDEKAGPWAIVEFLKNNPRNFLENTQLTILPLVNPVGFKDNCREGSRGLNPNRGYHQTDEKISEEGKILLLRLKELKEAAQDGEVALHEDPDIEQGGFVYCWKSGGGEELALKLRNVIAKFLGITRSETILKMEKADRKEDIIQEGIIADENDGDFGDWLHQEGIAPVVLTETPAKNINLETRIRVNLEIIKVFCLS